LYTDEALRVLNEKFVGFAPGWYINEDDPVYKAAWKRFYVAKSEPDEGDGWLRGTQLVLMTSSGRLLSGSMKYGDRKDLADALKSQIYRCWNRPEGYAADRANDLVVEFDLELGPDGRVIRADSSSVNPGNPSRYNYAAGVAARNAIFQCQPYRLPPERYNQWREINPMRFDPRQNP